MVKVYLSDTKSHVGKVLVEKCLEQDWIEVINSGFQKEEASDAAAVDNAAAADAVDEAADGVEGDAAAAAADDNEASSSGEVKGDGEAAAADAAEASIEEGSAEDVEDVKSEGDDYRALVENANVIILNLSSDSELCNNIINHVKQMNVEEPITLIGISTVMTWAKTVTKGNKPLRESRYKKRTSSLKYKNIKLLETLLLASRKENVSPFVIAPGVLYGRGEGEFHRFFRDAWICENSELTVIGAGNNRIPTLHVGDLATIVTSVVQTPPEQMYIVAVEQKQNTQKEIIQAISTVIGTGEVRNVDMTDDNVLLDVYGNSEVLLTDMSFDPENLWVHTLDLEWVAGNFTEAMAKVVRKEYIQARGLHPVRIGMYGAPGSGKSFYAKALAKQYYLPHIRIGDVIQEVLDRKDEVTQEVEKALEDAVLELKDSRKGKKRVPKKKKGKKPAPEEERPRIPLALLTRLIKNKLTSPVCRNKGFVLDGYPRTLEEAKLLFAKPLSEGEEYEEEEEPEQVFDEGEEGGEEGKGENLKPQDPNTQLTRLITLDVSEDTSAQRMKELPTEEYIKAHNDDEGFRRRFARYIYTMDEESNTNPLSWGYGVERLDVSEEVALEVDDALQKMSLYLESGGKAFNYHPTAEEEEEAQRVLEEKRADDEQRASKEEELKAKIEAADRKEKDLQEKIRREFVLREDQKLVEAMSLPLRKYLMANVIPALVDGLLDVCKVQPSDPVDHLADYLFRVATD
jgi:adenylate kinase